MPPREVHRPFGRVCQVFVCKTGEVDLAVPIEVTAGPALSQQLSHVLRTELLEVPLQRVVGLALIGTSLIRANLISSSGMKCARSMHAAPKQAGIEISDFDPGWKDAQHSGSLLERDRPQNEGICLHRALKLRPGWSGRSGRGR